MSAKRHSSPGSRKLGGCRGKYPTAIPAAVAGLVGAGQQPCPQYAFPCSPSPYLVPYQHPYQEPSSAAAALWKAQNNSLKTKKVSPADW